VPTGSLHSDDGIAGLSDLGRTTRAHTAFSMASGSLGMGTLEMGLGKCGWWDGVVAGSGMLSGTGGSVKWQQRFVEVFSHASLH
jgi:hypothetical protein